MVVSPDQDKNLRLLDGAGMPSGTPDAARSSGSRARSRRRLLISPRFQLAFLGWSMLMLFAVIGVFYGGAHVFFQGFRELGTAAGLPADHVIFQFLAAQQSQLNQVFFWTSLLSASILTVGSLWFSHRVAGPVYRLREHLDAMAEGRTFEDVRFRKRDFFPELAQACNRQFAVFRRYRRKSGRKAA